MNQSRARTFASLLREIDFIEIPVIQRDYAQGRREAREVRESFLEAIEKALKLPGHALNLDFVYGSVESDGVRRLSVLDGQQRLTTLFLLHWYLAALDGEQTDFRQRWTDTAGSSRFTYATRPSASDFFQSLVVNDMEIPSLASHTGMSAAIANARWFFDAWNRDPTVHSCLVMLDSIHQRFGSDRGLYRVLLDEPRVSFQYLDLHDFGLSDDLYIKMNARGKALTPFENFKAWLVERTAAESWSSEFALKLDQGWVDYFWSLAGRGKSLGFDQLFLRFWYLCAYFESARIVESFWVTPLETREWIQKLRDAFAFIPLREFDAHQSLQPPELKQLIEPLDYLTSEGGQKHVQILEKALDVRANYESLLRLYALIAFIQRVGSVVTDLEKAFGQWLRVTENLIVNSRIDEPSAAVNAIRGLTTLADHGADVYAALAQLPQGAVGFARDQVEEESRKAALILEDETWESLLIQAEAHWYLQGRVRFLLRLSERGTSHPDQTVFLRYLESFTRMFTPPIVQSREFVLQRALLSLYDYLPSAAAWNNTFCIPNAITYRDRLENWLPVIEDVRFAQLLDAIDQDAFASLHRLIAAGTATGWRALVVADPALIGYCGNRLIRKHDQDIFLLSKSRLSGYYAETRSYALWSELRRRREAGQLPEVSELAYLPVYGEDVYPTLHLRIDAKYSIRYGNGRWTCIKNDQDEVPLPTFVESITQSFPADPAPPRISDLAVIA